jgi:hypothetical protein
MPSLPVLKQRAKKAFDAKEKAKDKRKRAEALVVHLKNIENTLLDKFRKATAEYEAKAGPDDSDLGSTQESCE